MDLCWQSNVSVFFNMLSRFVIAFILRSKHLLISWLQSPSTLILEPPKIKSVTGSTVSPSICHEVMRPDAMILVFWMLSFNPTFSLSSFTFLKRLFSSSLSAVRVAHLHIWGYCYFSWQSWFLICSCHSVNVWWTNEWVSLEEYVGTVEGKEMGIGNLTFRISSGLDL